MCFSNFLLPNVLASSPSMNIFSSEPIVYAPMPIPVLIIKIVIRRPKFDSGLISLKPTVLMVITVM